MPFRCLFVLMMLWASLGAETPSPWPNRPVVAAIPEDFPPTYFRDPATGRPAGFAVEVLDAIARREGFQVVYRYGKPWEELMQMVQDGRADLIPNLVENPERARMLAFSRPVEDSPIHYFGRASQPSVRPAPGMKIGVIHESTAEVALRSRSDLITVPYESLGAMMFDLMTGKLDLVLTAAPNLQKLALDAGVEDRLRRLEPPFQLAHRGMALRTTDQALLQNLNRAIDAFVRTSEYQTIYTRWWGKPKPTWTAKRILGWSLALGGLTLLAMALWRHRSVQRLARHLGEEVQIRQRSEEALRLSEARFRTIFEQARDGIVIFTLEGTILAMNQAFAAIRGYTREELLVRPLWELDTPETVALAPSRMQRMMAGETIQVELEQLHKDGHRFFVEATGILVEFDGQPAVLSIHRDLAERKQLEAERASLQERLIQTQKMDSLGRLAGGIAHDMNNVLAAILGLASSQVARQPEGSPTRQVFQTIQKAAERGGSLVKGLLSFARQTAAEQQDLNLNEILLDEVRLLERTTFSKIRLQLELAEDLRQVRGDPGALSHAVMNLCVNAVDAMPEGGTLTLRSRNSADAIEIEVEDTGCGMSPEVVARAMDPFFTTKEPGKGTGLGLSIVYSTLATHGGQVSIHSEAGQGTRITLHLPASQSAQDATAPPAHVEPPPPRRLLRLLLVDDDEMVRTSTAMLLESLDHVVHTTDCGEDALRLLSEGLEVDGVILDMNMPGLGGEGTLPRLRAARPDLPVLLATGRADQTATDLVERDPHAVLLPKPFTRSDLKQRLADLP